MNKLSVNHKVVLTELCSIKIYTSVFKMLQHVQVYCPTRKMQTLRTVDHITENYKNYLIIVLFLRHSDQLYAIAF